MFYTQPPLCSIVTFRSNKKNCRQKQMGQTMVETESLKAAGIEREIFPLNEDDILLLSSDWHRICAPEETESKKMYSLVFWHQSSPEEKPSWDKVVSVLSVAVAGSTKDIGSLDLYQFGAIVYNPEGMSKTFCDRETSTLKADCAAIYQTTQ
jgi:hypothetical protein